MSGAPVCRLVLACAAVTAMGQATFNISTVKPNSANDNRVALLVRPGGNFVATGVPLKMLMREAYDVRNFQISGAPGWTDTDRWDIVAKAEGVTGLLPMEQFRPMLRTLIEERFQIKAHRETKEMQIYVLVVGKNGSKLQANSGEPGPQIRLGRGSLTFKKVNMTMFIRELGQQVGRTVVDNTGLTGEYDFALEFTPEPGQGPFIPGTPPAPPIDNAGPSIFTAIQEQLGLRLESQKGPVEIVVIDHVEKPSEN